MSFITCEIEPFVSQVTPQVRSLEHAASAAEIFQHQLGLYLRRLLSAICADFESISTGGVDHFIQLLDAPHSYLGQANRVVAVNGAENALEFITLVSGITRFVQLLDVPNSYIGASLRGVRVNAGETALEFYLRTLIGLADFPASYTSQALKALRVNAAANAVEFFVQSLLLLSDFPASFTGAALKYLRVNAGETAVEFATFPTLVTAFTQLSDVPGSYTAQALKAVRVNAAATALEFFVQSLLLLSDFPASFAGGAGKILRVNAGETAVEFHTEVFTDLTDVPNAYTGAAGKIVAVNAAATALEFVTSPNGTAFSSQLDWRVGIGAATSAGSFTTGYVGGPIWAGTGTVTFPAPATTNVLTSMGGRIRLTSGTLANSIIEGHSTVDFCWRGNAAGRGGFSFFYRFGNSTATVPANMRCFYGLIPSAATAPVGSVDPSSFLNCIGVGCDATDTVLSVFNNDGSGTATKTSLGAGFPSRASDTLYDIIIIAPSNGGNVTYSVTNLGTGAVATGTISTNLPSTTTFLGWLTWMATGAGGVLGAVYDFTRMTINFNP